MYSLTAKTICNLPKACHNRLLCTNEAVSIKYEYFPDLCEQKDLLIDLHLLW